MTYHVSLAGKPFLSLFLKALQIKLGLSKIEEISSENSELFWFAKPFLYACDWEKTGYTINHSSAGEHIDVFVKSINSKIISGSELISLHENAVRNAKVVIFNIYFGDWQEYCGDSASKNDISGHADQSFFWMLPHISNYIIYEVSKTRSVGVFVYTKSDNIRDDIKLCFDFASSLCQNNLKIADISGKVYTNTPNKNHTRILTQELAVESGNHYRQFILQTAVECHRKGNLNRAILLYSSVIIEDPAEWNVWRLIGVCKANIDNGAVKYLERSWNINNDIYVAHTYCVVLQNMIFQSINSEFLADRFNVIKKLYYVGDYLGMLEKVEPETRGKIRFNLAILIIKHGNDQDRLELAQQISSYMNKQGSYNDESKFLLRITMAFSDQSFSWDFLIEAAAHIARLYPYGEIDMEKFYITCYYLYSKNLFLACDRYRRWFFRSRNIKHLVDSKSEENAAYAFWYISRFRGEIFENPSDRAINNLSMAFWGRNAKAPKGDGPIYFVSADTNYWQIYGKRFVHSLGANTKNPFLHAHIIDPTGEIIEAALQWCHEAKVNVNVSTEIAPKFSDDAQSKTLKTYYASVRFVRICEAMEVYGQSVLALDIDSVLIGDLGAEVNEIDCDVLLSYGAHIGPWREFAAAMVFIRFCDSARAYIEFVRNYIINMFSTEEVFWTLDQAALYCSYIYLTEFGSAPKLSLADDRIKDLYLSAMGSHIEKNSALSGALAQTGVKA